jgi:hypothetical protein
MKPQNYIQKKRGIKAAAVDVNVEAIDAGPSSPSASAAAPADVAAFRDARIRQSLAAVPCTDAVLSAAVGLTCPHVAVGYVGFCCPWRTLMYTDALRVQHNISNLKVTRFVSSFRNTGIWTWPEFLSQWQHCLRGAATLPTTTLMLRLAAIDPCVQRTLVMLALQFDIRRPIQPIQTEPDCEPTQTEPDCEPTQTEPDCEPTQT